MRLHLTLFVLAIIAGSIASCKKDESLFSRVSSGHSNIHFNNLIDETEEMNVNTYMNIYTGAGVAAGDINNDGLVDLFFSGNDADSRLYINKGDFIFEDITETAGLFNNSWATGALMEDVNQDGWMDIYVCVSGNSPDKKKPAVHQ